MPKTQSRKGKTAMKPVKPLSVSVRLDTDVESKPPMSRNLVEGDRKPGTGAVESAVAAALAVLSARNAEWYGQNTAVCDCPDCTTARSMPRQCAVCGFHGPFVVAACECDEIRRSNLRFFRKRIREIGRGGTSPLSLDELGKDLAAEMIKPAGKCRGTSKQQGPCGHGDCSCPVCGALEKGVDASGQRILADPWLLIRRIREALTVPAALARADR